ncbi:MAG: 2-C-methyl-D-erythritol 4-phosphate cytidylyltransferase [Ignavibacteria bacterium]|nr:2-C-methyl-D-erythritol 4-phosphate cytidylyltransferase [Ignavibacteria bacterium]
MKVGLIISAAGVGKRFGSKIPKQFLKIKRKPLFLWTLENILGCIDFEPVVVTYPPCYLKFVSGFLEDTSFKQKVLLVEGGEERYLSNWNAIQNPKMSKTDYVFIHDAVRPFVTNTTLLNLFEKVQIFDAVVPGVKTIDTIKTINKAGYIVKTISREKLFCIQTPQAFKTALLIDAYKKAIEEKKVFTDDAGVIENYGFKVKLIEGDEINFKITTKIDFEIAKYIIEKGIYKQF